MNKQSKHNSSPKLIFEYTELVVDKGYSIHEAPEAKNTCKSTLNKWVRQLKSVHNAKLNSSALITPDHQLKYLETAK